MLHISERIAKANTLLAQFAVPHGTGLGREQTEDDDETRFPFQRDRDRIIHTQAFRRLKHKTQVFVAGKGDHYRTRLTHTMEVAQISRDMARTLGLNEDLVECIALAHDLGHTPFGHAGEDAMHEEMENRGGTFEHNQQSLRIVTKLEERTKRYPGLNLNREVLEGMMKHRTSFDEAHGEHIPHTPSLEAQIVNLADEIAYTAHDVDDGLRADVLHTSDMLKIPLFAEAKNRAKKSGTQVRGHIIHLLVTDAYEETEERLATQNITSLNEVYRAKEDIVVFSSAMTKKLRALREYLAENLYRSSAVIRHSDQGKNIVRLLFAAYETDPPVKVRELQVRLNSALPEAIKDYIAGMTDQYAMQQAASAQILASASSTGGK